MNDFAELPQPTVGTIGEQELEEKIDSLSRQVALAPVEQVRNVVRAAVGLGLASLPATRMPSLPGDEEIEGTPTVYSDRSHIRIYKEGMKFMRDYIKQSLGGVK